jgi:DNA-binding transcriptional MocR family regulator
MLPAERKLAERLGIGRTTVVAAYAELRRRDVVESQQGSGTRVVTALPEARAGQFAQTAALAVPDVIDLATSGLPAAPEVVAALRRVADAPDAAVLGSPGYMPAGLPRLRAAVAAHLTEQGLPTTGEQVLITTGDQQALALIGELLLERGDQVLVETPTFPGLLDVVRGRRAVARPVAGLTSDPESLAAAVRRGGPRLTYLVPTLGPEGHIATLEARERVLAVGGTAVLLEDLGQVDLAFEPVPPPLAALAPQRPILTIGSLSKLFWGGLRVGWIRAQRDQLARLVALKSRNDLGTPLLSQLVAVELLGSFAESRTRRLRQLVGQMEHALAVFTELAPELHVTRPRGGLSLWVGLPYPSDIELVRVARRQGVAVVAGVSFTANDAATAAIRVVYARPPGELREGVRRLAAAWRRHDAQAVDSAVPAVVV